MTTISQEQEQEQHSPVNTGGSKSKKLFRQQSSSEQEPLVPNHSHSHHQHHRPSIGGTPLLAKSSTFGGGRQQSLPLPRPPPFPQDLYSSNLGSAHRHHHFHHLPPLPQHHYHHSHPRLSQKHRQKLFSRSRDYRSVCSGTSAGNGVGGPGAVNANGAAGSQMSFMRRNSRCSRNGGDEDIEACPYHPWPEEPASVISERCTRARINSAIFVSSEGKGFDSIEFIRRYGSQSVLCRKARSAENVSASERKRRFSEHPEWESEESRQNYKMNGNNANGSSHNPHYLQHHQEQDSIEMVECHKEPVMVQVQSQQHPQPILVTTSNIVVGNTSLAKVGGNCLVNNNVIGTSSSSNSNGTATGICSSNGSSIESRSSAAVSISSGPIVSKNSNKPTPRLSNLPTLSVSGPSPPHEEEFLL
ncbi:uncharacterized protein LOC129756948 isoform X4 [Uranotaenia lowii]|uniref:uncharacterized protein LOC129756948 isoform X4 n=1 Tax=Uranotaenia lowii TaxID=190385 RepID=UPI00247AB366|nr:uncharacterized protein LOC129756948 isoform X4 [Uranotaenia lowii]